MGFLSVIGPCIGCGQLFSYNPYFVPSVMYGGEKQPVCKACIDEANEYRSKHGMELLLVHPQAYEAQECE